MVDTLKVQNLNLFSRFGFETILAICFPGVYIEQSVWFDVEDILFLNKNKLSEPNYKILSNASHKNGSKYSK